MDALTIRLVRKTEHSILSIPDIAYLPATAGNEYQETKLLADFNWTVRDMGLWILRKRILTVI